MMRLSDSIGQRRLEWQKRRSLLRREKKTSLTRGVWRVVQAVVSTALIRSFLEVGHFVHVLHVPHKAALGENGFAAFVVYTSYVTLFTTRRDRVGNPRLLHIQHFFSLIIIRPVTCGEPTCLK